MSVLDLVPNILNNTLEGDLGPLVTLLKRELLTNDQLRLILKFFRFHALNFNFQARRCVGIMYQMGLGHRQNLEEAAQWVTWTEEIPMDHLEYLGYIMDKTLMGEPRALNMLTYLFRNKHFLEIDQWITIMKFFRFHVLKYNSYAANCVGLMFMMAVGVEQDLDEAYRWFKLSADQGNSYGQINLGYMYLHGFGLADRDHWTAIDYFEQSALQGNSIAQNNLGYMYKMGSNQIPIDHKKAYQWFKLSSEQHNMFAQSHLADMYRFGLGMQADKNSAMQLYTQSVYQGHKSARERLKI